MYYWRNNNGVQYERGAICFNCAKNKYLFKTRIDF